MDREPFAGVTQHPATREVNVHVTPHEQGHLPVHTLSAALVPGDPSIPLRLVSLLGRRGVAILELSLTAGSADDTDGQGAPALGRVTVSFRATERHARVIAAGFDSTVNVLEVSLSVGFAPRELVRTPSSR